MSANHSRKLSGSHRSTRIASDLASWALAWVHQNRASPFASDFCLRGGCLRELRSEDHFYPLIFSQKKSQFASDSLRRGNRAIFWGAVKSLTRDFLGSAKNRRRSRRESRDFGALRRSHRRPTAARVRIAGISHRSFLWFQSKLRGFASLTKKKTWVICSTLVWNSFVHVQLSAMPRDL